MNIRRHTRLSVLVERFVARRRAERARLEIQVREARLARQIRGFAQITDNGTSRPWAENRITTV
jgi:hypothetical protein